MTVEWPRRYRFLMLVYGLALLAGLYEYFDRRPADSPADAMRTLYPRSAEIQYVFGRGYEKEGAEFQRRGEQAASRDALENARHHFENALATGVKTDENLFYHYALVLVLLNADAADIDRAIAAWRYNFPDSKRPDPRDPSSADAALGEFQRPPGRY